jgi:hypothetical protein
MRKGLMVLLGLGVVLGYGSAIARVGHYRNGCHERWNESRRYDASERSRWNAPPAPLAVAPSAPAPAPAAAPLVIVIPINGMSQPASPVVVPMPTLAVVPVPATSASPSVGPQ